MKPPIKSSLTDTSITDVIETPKDVEFNIPCLAIVLSIIFWVVILSLTLL